MRFRPRPIISKAKSKSLPSVFPAESSVDTIDMLKQYANAAAANDESTSACELCGVKFHSVPSSPSRNASTPACGKESPSKSSAKKGGTFAGATTSGAGTHGGRGFDTSAIPATLKDMNAATSARRLCFVEESVDGFHSAFSMYYFEASQVYVQLFQALRASRARAPLLANAREGLGSSSTLIEIKTGSPTAKHAEASHKPGSARGASTPMSAPVSPPGSEKGSANGSGSGRPPYLPTPPPLSAAALPHKNSPETDQVHQLTNLVLTLLNKFFQLVSNYKSEDKPGRFVTQLLSITIPTLRVFLDWLHQSQMSWHITLTGHAFVGEEKNVEYLVTLIALHRQLMQIHYELSEMDKFIETMHQKSPDCGQLPSVIEEFQNHLHQTHMYLALLTNAILDNGARLTALFLKPFKSYTLKSVPANTANSNKSVRHFQIDLGECMAQTFFQRFANEFISVVSPSSSYLFPLFLDKCIDVTITEMSQCEMAKMVESIIQSIDIVRLWAYQRESEYNAKASLSSARLHLSNINAFLRLEVIRVAIQETPGFNKSSRLRMDPFRKLARSIANRSTSIGNATAQAATVIQGHLLTMGRTQQRGGDESQNSSDQPLSEGALTNPSTTPPNTQRRSHQFTVSPPVTTRRPSSFAKTRTDPAPTVVSATASFPNSEPAVTIATDAATDSRKRSSRFNFYGSEKEKADPATGGASGGAGASSTDKDRDKAGSGGLGPTPAKKDAGKQ